MIRHTREKQLTSLNKMEVQVWIRKKVNQTKTARKGTRQTKATTV